MRSSSSVSHKLKAGDWKRLRSSFKSSGPISLVEEVQKRRNRFEFSLTNFSMWGRVRGMRTVLKNSNSKFVLEHESVGKGVIVLTFGIKTARK